MKKNLLSALYLVMAACALLFVQSCTKEKNESVIFYAKLQQYNSDSKVHIESSNIGKRYSCWDDGDQIRFHGAEGHVTFDPQTGLYMIQSSSLITYGGTETVVSIYPAELWPTGATITTEMDIHLVPTQKYEVTTDGQYQKLKAPMAAYMPASDWAFNSGDPATAPTLEFKNVCALMEVTIRNESTDDITVTRIEVENSGSNGKPLWGDEKILFDISAAHNHSMVEDLDEGDYASLYITREVTLDCEEHGEGGVVVGANESKSFYIYLPPVSYDKLRVTAYAKDDDNEFFKTLYSTRTTTGTFVANTIYRLPVTFENGDDNSWDILSHQHDLGPYTVNENGTQVLFDFSNLHHDGSVFFFPPYQYDFVSYNDPNHDVDQFNLVPVQHTRTVGDETETYYTFNCSGSDGTNYGPFMDENGLFTDPHRSGVTWRLLDYDEWNYLLKTRDQTNRFVNTLVASVPGIILFPDNFSLPTLSVSLTGINDLTQDFASNELPLHDFYILENSGCVFLPCVHYGINQMSSIQDDGYYRLAPTQTQAHWSYQNPQSWFGLRCIRLIPGASGSNMSEAPGNSGFFRFVRNYSTKK